MPRMNYRFVALVTAEISVEAESEDEARDVARDMLHTADTDFIRSDHWNASPVVAEFSIGEMVLKTKED